MIYDNQEPAAYPPHGSPRSRLVVDGIWKQPRVGWAESMHQVCHSISFKLKLSVGLVVLAFSPCSPPLRSNPQDVTIHVSLIALFFSLVIL